MWSEVDYIPKNLEYTNRVYWLQVIQVKMLSHMKLSMTKAILLT